MSDEVGGCLAIIFVVLALGLIGKCAVDSEQQMKIDQRAAEAAQIRECKDALRGVTSGDSVRVYRVQPKCLEAKP